LGKSILQRKPNKLKGSGGSSSEGPLDYMLEMVLEKGGPSEKKKAWEGGTRNGRRDKK